jgi:DNA-binding MarR family transcriptional regulator
VVTHTCGSASSWCGLSVNGGDAIAVGLQEGLERLSCVVREAAGGGECWLERIGAGVLALLGFLDDEPLWAGSLILERPLGGALVGECARRVHGALGVVLEEGRGGVIVGADINPSTALIAELVTLGGLSLIRMSMLRQPNTALVDLAALLMSAIVVPYLGLGAAKADRRAGAELVAAAASEVPVRAAVVPIRPQPHALLVLRVLVSAPLSGNREIGLATGLDSKQTLKAVRLLEQRGLIENARSGLASRAPNAWLLTPYGERILELITDSFAAAGRREHDGSAERALRIAARTAARESRPAGRVA